jgi:hypothetical protein
MTRQIVRLLRTEERAGGKPGTELTDRLREFRQLTESLAEYRRTRGVSAEAEDFFSTLTQRMDVGNEYARASVGVGLYAIVAGGVLAVVGGFLRR